MRVLAESHSVSASLAYAAAGEVMAQLGRGSACAMLGVRAFRRTTRRVERARLLLWWPAP
jgi:hypothetical protein